MAGAPPAAGGKAPDIDVEAGKRHKAEKPAEKPVSEKLQKKSAEWRYPAKPNFLSRLFFIDVDPLINLGYRVRLEPEHMHPDPTLSTKRLYGNLEPAWQAQQAKPRPDLKRALLRGNMGTLIYTGVLYGISQACSLAGPLLLREIVSGLQCESAQRRTPVDIGCQPRSKLYFFLIGLFLAPAIQSVCENQNLFLLYVMGTRMRNALMATIYRKCLRLSNGALQAESTGKVVTLMSNDAQKLQDAMFAIHAMWGSPIYIIAVLVLLWFEVGWATFVGLGVMLALVPATGFMAAKLGMLRRSIMGWTDKRVGRMNELINGIQMIKFYAWESSFRTSVMEARAQEAIILRKMAFWQGVFGLLLFYGPVAVALFTFGSYAIAGEVLTPAKAYTALALFSLLRFPMSFLPMLVTMIVNALVAIKRIQGFLVREEAALQPWDQAKTAVGQVVVRDGTFTWTSSAEKPAGPAGPPGAKGGKDAGKGAGKGADAGKGKGGKDAAKEAAGKGGKEGEKEGKEAAAVPDVPTLRNLNLDAKPGSLTMVVGGVGSGKSSLLAALIGHITKLKGEVELGGRIAYVAQSAWVMNDTLQENVLLGAPLDPERYRNALEVSQLGPDLDILPNGDLTEIGDRGITLSGGQKQRVSIARAVYAAADVYLLDDPLSAVDSHVGRALFDQVIRGVLKGKTVVLVTNALQYLPHADTILWMEEGEVRAQGSYAQLVEAGLNLEELCHDEHEDAAEDAAKDAEAKQTAAHAAGAPAPINTTPADAKSGPSAGSAAAPASHPVKRTSAEKRGSLDKRTSVEKRRSIEKAASIAAVTAPHATQRVADSKITLTRQAQDANRNLTGVETRESGAISGDVISKYFKAGGGWAYFIPLLCLFGLEQGARVYTDTWVGNWFGDKYDRNTAFYLGIYFMLGVVYGLATFIRSLTFLFFCVRASLSVHNQLLDHILALPKSFFDTNPAGRILNRFSRDTDIMDSTLSASLIQFAGSIATYIAILVVITIATYWFGIALVPLTIIYFTMQRYYIPSARELQRIESITRSPIYSRFAEALAGVPTIRAYRMETHFTEMSDTLMERNAYAFVTQKLAAGWLGMRLDMLGLLVLTLAGALCIQGGIDPGMAGLALVYALDLTRFLKHGTNMASKSEADFNSVERIVQYLDPETEAAADTAPEVLKTLPAEWPTAGAIEVKDLHMRYREGMPLVLRGVSFSVQPGEKVGLVGRTGSGKSSLLLSLFRMVEPASGGIVIDGVDIATLGVRHLRSKMSIIPQDPFMFSGSVRHNLDPFQTASDDDLWRAVESVGLSAAIGALEGKLESKVVDGGANFSLGQRQLFCLARAMLRKSKILMLDEATASVDVDTDANIQAALRLQFGEVTCLTIAHRLNTIMDSDRVVVLDAGRVVEDDEPIKLLDRTKSAFKGMVEQTGRSSARYLTSLARNASVARTESLARGGSGARSVAVYERIRSVFGTGASFANRGSMARSRLGDSAYGAVTDSDYGSESTTPKRVGTVGDLQALEEGDHEGPDRPTHAAATVTVGVRDEESVGATSASSPPAGSSGTPSGSHVDAAVGGDERRSSGGGGGGGAAAAVAHVAEEAVVAAQEIAVEIERAPGAEATEK